MIWPKLHFCCLLDSFIYDCKNIRKASGNPLLQDQSFFFRTSQKYIFDNICNSMVLVRGLFMSTIIENYSVCFLNCWMRGEEGSFSSGFFPMKWLLKEERKASLGTIWRLVALLGTERRWLFIWGSGLVHQGRPDSIIWEKGGRWRRRGYEQHFASSFKDLRIGH